MTTKDQKKILGWKKAFRKAIEKMNPAGFIEMPDNRFLVMFDRKLVKQNEKEMAETLRLKLKGSGFAYTFNSEARIKPFGIFPDAEIIGVYSNMVIYNTKVDESFLSGLKDFQFKFKTQIDLYEVEYID